MKALLALTFLTLSLIGCTSPPISNIDAPAASRGTPLGDTGIRVSGAVDAGGSATR